MNCLPHPPYKTDSVDCAICLSSDSKNFCFKDGFQYVSCSSCGHVYVKNRVSPDQLIDIYTNRKSHHNSLIKQEWDFPELKRKYYYNPLLRSIGRQAPRKGRLLDIGCASEAFLNAARIAGWEVLGLELETASVEIARAHDLTVYPTTLQEQAFPDNHFDAVTMWEVLEHLDDPRLILQEIYRILKPDGILALSTPNIHSLGWFLLKEDWPCLTPVAHPNLFNSKSLRRLAEECGFSCRKLETLEIQPHTVNQYLNKFKRHPAEGQTSNAVAKLAKQKSRLTMKTLLTLRHITNIPLKFLNLGENLYGFFKK